MSKRLKQFEEALDQMLLDFRDLGLAEVTEVLEARIEAFHEDMERAAKDHE